MFGTYALSPRCCGAAGCLRPWRGTRHGTREPGISAANIPDDRHYLWVPRGRLQRPRQAVRASAAADTAALGGAGAEVLACTRCPLT
jgi:hypothetical protein